MNQRTDTIIFILGTLILVFFAFSLIIFLIIHKRKQYRNQLEKQQMENRYQTQLLQTQLEVQEQSFKYFSEEIHDNVGQLLSIIKLQLFKIANSSSEEATIHDARSSIELVGKAITDLRNISHTLNSSFIDKAGLCAAIEKEMGYIRSAKEIDCHLHKTGDEYNLSPDRELLVFRIIQEAMANAIKHAAPNKIAIYLSYNPQKITVEIKDDGSGFNTAEYDKPGIGLNNMLVRAGMLNGTLNINSAKGTGTTILLDINR
jgi:signal transduction histidine kinase